MSCVSGTSSVGHHVTACLPSLYRPATRWRLYWPSYGISPIRLQQQLAVSVQVLQRASSVATGACRPTSREAWNRINCSRLSYAVVSPRILSAAALTPPHPTPPARTPLRAFFFLACWRSLACAALRVALNGVHCILCVAYPLSRSTEHHDKRYADNNPAVIDTYSWGVIGRIHDMSECRNVAPCSWRCRFVRIVCGPWASKVSRGWPCGTVVASCSVKTDAIANSASR